MKTDTNRQSFPDPWSYFVADDNTDTSWKLILMHSSCLSLHGVCRWPSSCLFICNLHVDPCQLGSCQSTSKFLLRNICVSPCRKCQEQAISAHTLITVGGKLQSDRVTGIFNLIPGDDSHWFLSKTMIRCDWLSFEQITWLNLLGIDDNWDWPQMKWRHLLNIWSSVFLNGWKKMVV